MENIKQVFSTQRFVHPFYIIFFLFIFSGNHSFSQNASIGEKKFEGTQEMNNLLSEYVKKADFNNLGGLILNDQGVLFYKEKLKTATVDQYNYVRTEYANQLLLSGKVNESIEEVEKIMKEISVNENYKGPSKNILRNLLALCYFRLGEQENCILGNTAGSCIFPIQGDGIYKIKSPTRKALSIYNEILADDSNDLESRWILNLGYMVLGIYPDSVPKRYLIPAHKFDSDYKIGKFKNVSQGLGLDLSSLAGSVCMEDFDNDGDLDLFVDNEDLVVPCKYFVNNGDGTFTEKTKEAGLMGIIGGRMASTADYNNDGFTDIFVTRGAWMADENNFPPNSLLKNNGDGTFSDVTIESEVLSFFPTSCASWADFNNDGYADLFVGNETTDQGSPHTCELYLNNGKGHFENVAKECGIVVNGFVKSVSWGDYNNDGWQDLYVSIIKGPNLLFKNNGKDTSGKVSFTEVSQQAGVTKPYYGFPAFFFDFDNDGWLDIYASAHSLGYLDISKIIPGEYLGNSSSSNNQTKLYHNNHNGTFTDISNSNGFISSNNISSYTKDGFTKAKEGMPSDSKIYDYKQFPTDPKPKRYKLYKEDQEQINEISYRRFAENVSKVSPERKLVRALNEVRKRIREIEQVIEYSNRLKTENTIKKESFWTSKTAQLGALSERLNELSNKIRTLSQ